MCRRKLRFPFLTLKGLEQIYLTNWVKGVVSFRILGKLHFSILPRNHVVICLHEFTQREPVRILHFHWIICMIIFYVFYFKNNYWVFGLFWALFVFLPIFNSLQKYVYNLKILVSTLQNWRKTRLCNLPNKQVIRPKEKSFKKWTRSQSKSQKPNNSHN